MISCLVISTLLLFERLVFLSLSNAMAQKDPTGCTATAIYLAIF